VTFDDIFKSSFLDNMASVTILDMVLALAAAFGLGLFIFFVYKKTFKGVMYSGSFGVSLIALAMITTLVILAVTSNVVLSLGMVGALSIVRFRTAIKDPLDIVFLFWSIAVGIVLAAGLFPLAIFGSVVVGIILLVFVNRRTNDLPYILVVTCEDADAEKAAVAALGGKVGKSQIKGKTVTDAGVELNYEVRLKDNDDSFVNALQEIDGVERVVLVGYNGDYLG
jgi:uncharacterized membrane protein YhiD involved in acid resistance